VLRNAHRFRTTNFIVDRPTTTYDIHLRTACWPYLELHTQVASIPLQCSSLIDAGVHLHSTRTRWLEDRLRIIIIIRMGVVGHASLSLSLFS